MLGNLGWVHTARQQDAAAMDAYRQGLSLMRRLGDRRGIAVCLEGLAELASRRGQARDAVRLCGAVATLRRQIGSAPAPGEHARVEETLARARRAPEAEAVASAWAEGRALPLEHAISIAVPEVPS